MLCFNLMCCAKKVNKLINQPVMSVFGTRVSGTGTEMIAQCVYPKLPTTTNRKRLLRNHWDLSVHRRGEKCLSETSRPGLISTVRPDLFIVNRVIETESILVFLCVYLQQNKKGRRPKGRKNVTLKL
jgi:hypothetical protein